jgi:hypothetical protein
MPAYRRHFCCSSTQNIQASLRLLREQIVHVGSRLKQLDAFHNGIALASARQLGGFGFEP